MHYTYVLRSLADQTTYIGSTSDLQRRVRVAEHNAGRSGYTKSRMPWKLIYYEACETLGQARKREHFLKNHSATKEELLKRILEAPSSIG